jgi:hypothetical protein
MEGYTFPPDMSASAEATFFRDLEKAFATDGCEVIFSVEYRELSKNSENNRIVALANLIHSWDESSPADIVFIEKITGMDYQDWLKIVPNDNPKDSICRSSYNSDLRYYFTELKDLFVSAIAPEITKLSGSQLSPSLLSGLTYGILILSINKLQVDDAISFALTDENWLYWAENKGILHLCEAAPDIFWAKFMDAYHNDIIPALYKQKKINSDNMIASCLELVSHRDIYAQKAAEILLEIASIDGGQFALILLGRIICRTEFGKSEMQQLIKNSFEKGFAPQLYKHIFYHDYKARYAHRIFSTKRRGGYDGRADYEDGLYHMHCVAIAFLEGFREWKFIDLEKDALTLEDTKRRYI